ncbi:cytochrome P450 [Sporolactobacillus shoreicorticis]|uniref:Cytochrome P450 n=1 Tax=Sporolactobacillus shoreicorticis TaxID=1923877 RepID=A0ABW5S7U3_9BACL|nr:cytochrome P450 [Sporolactobacillus shoreicorticis]MCO7126035.1 cytochrome P450 [Sporolactobacillus shoreicorticis]
MDTEFAQNYDPLDPETLINPYPIYERLREHAPIFWHKRMKSWVLSRYDDCKEVLRNYQLFARDRRRIGKDIPDVKHNLQSLDPPNNKSLRNLMIKAFNSQDIEKIKNHIHVLISEILNKQAAKNRFNFMTEVSAPLSLRTTSILLGVKEPNLKIYMDISDAIAHQMDSGLKPEYADPGNKARMRLNEFVDVWFTNEQDSGILPFIRKNKKDVKIPEYYIRNTTATMFNASFGTLYAAFGNIVFTLLKNPDVLTLLKDNSLFNSGINELIRFDGPAQATSRFAVETMTLGGEVISKGDSVITLLASANHDPRMFPQPESIVLHRSKNPHLAFGWGVHACLGKLFGELAIQELIKSLQETPKILNLVDKPRRRETATVRCIDDLPVSYK